MSELENAEGVAVESPIKVNEVKKLVGRALVVDDDKVTLRLLTSSLLKQGYEVVPATNVCEAIEILETEGARTFDCALVDYRMPGRTGTELLAWLKSFDPTLASMMLTAEGDKALVAQILREGAVDYLDKPFRIAEVRESVRKAVEISRQRRYLADTESAATKVGEAHHHLLGIRHLANLPQVRICYQPMYQAGGDFINVFPHDDERFTVLAGDVSGHDLRAAYISTFAQGVVRGMMEKDADIDEVFTFFNRFLVNECNSTDGVELLSESSTTSFAMCSLSIDQSTKEIHVKNSGFPLPMYVDSDGDAETMGEGCCPLGWFEDLSVPRMSFPFKEGANLYLWSDGLEDYAEKLEICPTSLAFRLLDVGEAERKTLLADAIDDVLIVQLHLSRDVASDSGCRPLIVETHSGADASKIDEIQARWERSLRYALPSLPTEKLYDVLLTSREGVLNAMEHGCRGDAEKTCSYQVFLLRNSKQIRIRISDPGGGHSDDYLSDEEAPTDPLERHCGFILLKALSSTIQTGRNGATLVMDFDAAEGPAALDRAPIFDSGI